MTTSARRSALSTPFDPGRSAGLPDYHVMVLLVDDQAMVCEAIRRALANQPDIDFHYCADGREAVSIANQIKPTVILQDLVMPGTDGLTLVNQFRANPATKDIPIIVLSTNEGPQVKGQAFALGANDYLVKLPDKIEPDCPHPLSFPRLPQYPAARCRLPGAPRKPAAAHRKQCRAHLPQPEARRSHRRQVPVPGQHEP